MPYIKARIRRRNCLHCGKATEGNKKRRYCSGSCRALASRERRSKAK